MKSVFKKTINWNKYQSKVTTERQNQYLDYFTDASFQEVNKLFYHLKIMQLEQDTQYFISTVEKKDYNVLIDGQNVFDQPVENDIRTYDNIPKFATAQEGDYINCFLDYTYFKKYYKMIAIHSSKQQVLDADPKAIQQINFTGYLDGDANTTMFIIIEEAKETMLEFSQGTVRVL